MNQRGSILLWEWMGTPVSIDDAIFERPRVFEAEKIMNNADTGNFNLD